MAEDKGKHEKPTPPGSKPIPLRKGGPRAANPGKHEGKDKDQGKGKGK